MITGLLSLLLALFFGPAFVLLLYVAGVFLFGTSIMMF